MAQISAVSIGGDLDAEQEGSRKPIIIGTIEEVMYSLSSMVMLAT